MSRTPDEERLGARLDDWVTRLRHGTVTVIVATIGLMIGLAVFYRQAPHAATVIRQFALLMMVGHSVTHAVSIAMLRVALWKRVPNAEKALAAYLDPLRITHRDIAAAWILYYVFAPRLMV